MLVFKLLEVNLVWILFVLSQTWIISNSLPSTQAPTTKLSTKSSSFIVEDSMSTFGSGSDSDLIFNSPTASPMTCDECYQNNVIRLSVTTSTSAEIVWSVKTNESAASRWVYGKLHKIVNYTFQIPPGDSFNVVF